MYQYIWRSKQSLSGQYLISTSMPTFNEHNLTMLGKVGLRRNDFLFFQSEPKRNR